MRGRIFSLITFNPFWNVSDHKTSFKLVLMTSRLWNTICLLYWNHNESKRIQLKLLNLRWTKHQLTSSIFSRINFHVTCGRTNISWKLWNWCSLVQYYWAQNIFWCRTEIVENVWSIFWTNLWQKIYWMSFLILK